MKLALFFCLAFSLNVFAKDVKPMSFGVQYLEKSIVGQPMVTFLFKINASDLQPGNFGTIAAKFISLKDSSEVIVPAGVVYRKSKSTKVEGSGVLAFSYDGVVALKIIKALRTAKIVLSADNGLEFSINLADLCVSSPNSFYNMLGRTGCNVDTEAIDQLIREMTDKSSHLPSNCNEEKSLTGLIELACSGESIRKKIEAQFNCLFTCP